LEDLGVDKRIILKMDIQQVGWGGMDWIDMAQERDWWWAIFNAFRFHKTQGILSLAENLLVSQEEVCSMEL